MPFVRVVDVASMGTQSRVLLLYMKFCPNSVEFPPHRFRNNSSFPPV